MKMHVLVLICSVFAPFFGMTQQLPHPSIWPTEYNIQYHIARAFINRMIDRGHSQVWDTNRKTFVSPIYDHLTFPEGANSSYSVTMSENKQALTDFFKSDFTDFSMDRFEEYFRKGKKSGKTSITYDSLGRMLEMNRVNRPSFNNKEKELFTFDYGFNRIDVNVKTSSFYWFANYSSSIAGNIRYRPLRLKTSWGLTQYMNSNACTDSVVSLYKSRANIRKDYENGSWNYYFDYDTIGRLTHEKILIGRDSIHQEYYHAHSDHKLLPYELSDFWISKSPPVKRWLDSINEPLYVSQPDEKRSAAATIRTKDFKMIGTFGKSPTISTRLIDYFYDSISEYRAIYNIRKIDSLDSIPYPGRKQVNKQRESMIIEPNRSYVRPHGLLDVVANVYRRSEITLKSGWTIIRYQRGSDNYTKAALGHKPMVRLEMLYDRYLFIDPQGEIKYVYSYKKLYKIEKLN